MQMDRQVGVDEQEASNGSAALTPLPKSAVAARRASGVGCWPGSSGWRRRIHTRPGPELAGSREPAHLHRAARRSSPRSEPSSAKRIGSPLGGRASSAARSPSAVGARRCGRPRRAPPCTRSALRAHDRLARRPCSSAASSCTRRPGRTIARRRASAARAGSGAGTRRTAGRCAARRPARTRSNAERSARPARRRAARAGPTARAPARSARSARRRR